MRRFPAVAASALLALMSPAAGGSGTPATITVAPPVAPPATIPAGLAAHERFAAGFGVDTPARVASAAADGVTQAILYQGAPRPSSRLGRALERAHMHVIDASI